MTSQQVTYNGNQWIHIVGPTLEELTDLQKQYPYLTPLTIEDITSPIERPKIDRANDYLYVILAVPRWSDEERLRNPHKLNLILAKGVLVTIEDDPFPPLEKMFETVRQDEAKRRVLLEKDAASAFVSVVDLMIDQLFPILDEMDQKISSAERRLATREALPLIREVGLLRLDIISVSRVIHLLVPVMEDLNARVARYFPDDMSENLDDILDHVHSAKDLIAQNSAIMDTLADTTDKILTSRLNNIIRILTIISVLFLPLNLLAGIYGMNLPFLPIAEHPQSFFILTGAMLVIAVCMLAYFRYRRWF